MRIETKKKIETALQAFVQGNLTKNALGLFTALDYTTDRQAPLTVPKYAEFKTEKMKNISRRFGLSRGWIRDIYVNYQ